MLDLAPRTERRLQKVAAREGVDADALINRLLEQTISFPADTSDAQKRAAVLAYIHLSDHEVARLHAPDIAHFDAQLAEAAKATPEEVAEDEAEWETYTHAMNETRRASGERSLYREETAAP